MANTSSQWGGNDALEGVFGHGRKDAVCGSPASRWRNFAESLGFPVRPATRSSIAIRNVAFRGSRTEAGVPIATPTNFLSGRELRLECEARAPQLGCSKNPRTLAPQIFW